MPRIGLVLGAGGAVGHAFHAGVFAALAEATGWDRTRRGRDRRHVGRIGRRRAAARRRSRLPTSRPARPTDALSERGRRLVARADAARHDTAADPGASRTPTAPGDVGAGRARARRAATVEHATGRARGGGAARRPRADRARRVRAASAVHQLARPDRCGSTRSTSNAAGASRSAATALRRSPTSPTAVAASCAIPAFFAPVSIDGVRYVDGGVHSPTNADLVAGLGARPRRGQLADVDRADELRDSRADQPARRFARFRARCARSRASAEPARRCSRSNRPTPTSR